MRMKGFDLNLLVALEALLTEQNVSRAAQRLNLSQPAASAALARLRAYFQDDILSVSGRRMLPTAHADSLAPLLADVMQAVERLLATSADFDPATSQRTFRIVASDYITTVLLTPLLPELERLAPRIRLELLFPNDQPRDILSRGEIDLLLTLEEYASPDHPSEFLLEEPHVVVGWSGNPMLAGPLTEESFCDLGHVVVELGVQQRRSFAELQMAKLGLKRRIEVVAPAFSSVPWMLPHTMRVSVMHERLARAFLPILPLKILPLPFAFPMMREVVQYHRTREFDAGLRWLLQIMKAQSHVTAASIDAVDDLE
jgi:LysR family nod box-dependent transcriptional activator